MPTLTEWQRFVANAPEAQREYRTLEIYHPQLDTVYRFVVNYCNKAFTLEEDAPRNAGESVEFEAATLNIVEPAEREDSEQALQVEIGNVDGRVNDIIEQISGVGFFTSVDVVYRKYYSGDLSGPAVPPLYLFASNLVFSGPTSVAFTAEDVDLSQKRAGEIYDPVNFPGLRD